MTRYNLDVPDDLWTQFKGTITGNETLNERLVELIQEEVNDD